MAAVKKGTAGKTAPKKTAAKKTSASGSYAVRLVEALGNEPATSYTPLEQVLGWSLPPEVGPFADMLADDRMPPSSGWYYLYDKHGPKKDSACPPWKVFSKLAKDPKALVSHFLHDHRVYGVLLGLIGFAEDPGGDYAFVDVGPGAKLGEVYVHNHDFGRLGAKNVTFGAFVRERYSDLWLEEDDEEISETEARIGKLGKPPKADRERSRELMKLYEANRWLIAILRGEYEELPKPSAPPRGSGPLVLHHELLASAVLGDEARARKAVSAGKKAKGLLTRALAAQVEAVFASPKSAQLGWLKPAKLGELHAHFAHD